MKLVFEQINVGGDRNFAYLVGDRESGECVLIDPSYSFEKVLSRVEAQKLKVTYIINTHGHADHINANTQVKEHTSALIAAYIDSPINPDLGLKDNDQISIGSFKLQALHTPGHADDHLVLVLLNQDIAFTGDLIFTGKVGGTKDETSARIEYKSLQRMINELSATTTLWPGHDYGCRPSTTMRLEKESNPFLSCKSVEEFIALKENWSTFKSEYGLK